MDISERWFASATSRSLVARLLRLAFSASLSNGMPIFGGIDIAAMEIKRLLHAPF